MLNAMLALSSAGTHNMFVRSYAIGLQASFGGASWVSRAWWNWFVRLSLLLSLSSSSSLCRCGLGTCWSHDDDDVYMCTCVCIVCDRIPFDGRNLYSDSCSLLGMALYSSWFSVVGWPLRNSFRQPATEARSRA